MNEREFSLIKAISEEFSANIAELKIELKKEIDEKFIDLEGKVEFLKQSLPIQNLNIDDVSSLIDKGFSSILKQTIANLPIPKDGKSVTAEELRPMIEEEIAKYLPEPIDTNVLVDEVLKQIPKPEKVKDEEEIIKIISETFSLLFNKEIEDIKALKASLSSEVIETKISNTLKTLLPEPIDINQIKNELIETLPIQETQELPNYDEIISETVNKSIEEKIKIFPTPKDGKSVTAEELRPMIEEEIAKYLPEPIDTNVLVDEVLKQIPKPEKAKDGRDALNLEISPLIDEKKSYPRGTYAIHNGGLWRSHEQTHGMRGWECVVDGVATIEMEQQNKRCFSISIKKSSGFEELKSFEIPVMIYRDIFKSGNEYQPGDTVTWGGSLWHCNQKTMDKPGEPNSIGWTLAVKKGRDLRGKP